MYYKENWSDNIIQIIISRSGADEATLTSISSRPSKISLTRLLILQVFLGLVPLLPSPNLPLVVLEVAIYLE